MQSWQTACVSMKEHTALCFKCFFNILELVYRERLYHVMVGWQFKVTILKLIKLIQNKTFLF